MTLSRHQNLLSVKGAFVNGSKLYIVSPLLYAGSCLDIMRVKFIDGLDEGSISCILKQALCGLEYLHRTGLIHRDVKSGNLLMDEDGTVKLADFGVSASLFDVGGDRNRSGVRKTFVGTPCWIAPVHSSRHFILTVACVGSGTADGIQSEGRHLVIWHYGIGIGSWTSTVFAFVAHASADADTPK